MKNITVSKQAAFFIFFFLLFSCQDDISDIAPEPSSDPDELYFPPNNNEEWESQSLSSLGWNADKWKELSNLLEANDTRAFIVLKDGKIVIEQYYGKSISNIDNFDKSKIWYWASAGKTLTSFIVGKAQEDGFLKISDKASDYLGSSWTSLTSTQEAKISVRNQLTMTSGLDDSVSESDDFAPEKLIYKADAGSRWAYHNAPYTLLDQVVENAVGVEFESYFDNVLQNIIGMNGTWTWLGSNHVYFSTARDMARFGLLMLAEGQWNGTQVMKDNSYFTAMINPSQSINKSYGYLWWLNGKESYMIPQSQVMINGPLSPFAPDDMYSALGKNGQFLSIIPSQNIVMVRMGDNPDQSLVPFLFLNDIWKVLSQVIAD